MPRGGERPVCSVPGCGRPHLARGWCQMHHGRWRKTGDPLKVRKGGRRFAVGTELKPTVTGAILIKLPGHHLARGMYVRRSRLVFEKAYGIKLTENDVVRHRDGNSANDSPDNLFIVKAHAFSRCKTCGKLFIQTKLKRKRFCSHDCANIGNRRTHVKRPCLNCGRLVKETWAHRRGGRVFCSRKCGNTIMSGERQSPTSTQDRVLVARTLNIMGTLQKELTERGIPKISSLISGKIYKYVPIYKGDEDEFLLEAIAYRSRTLDES